MHALAIGSFGQSDRGRTLALAVTATLLALLLTASVYAAGTTGTALKPAFDLLNDIVGGYGKQLLVLVGFIAAAFALLAVNATSAILKFIGFVIFLAVALGAAVSLSGAII
jgi:hypothetical protein